MRPGHNEFPLITHCAHGRVPHPDQSSVASPVPLENVLDIL